MKHVDFVHFIALVVCEITMQAFQCKRNHIILAGFKPSTGVGLESSLFWKEAGRFHLRTDLLFTSPWHTTRLRQAKDTNCFV